MANTEYNYILLANTIVSEAADEYKRNRFILDMINTRKFKNEAIKERVINNAKREIKDIERFFKSEWFKTLSGLDGERAFKHLEETYLNEYVPTRLKLMKKKGSI